jgi:hypothetical protein
VAELRRWKREQAEELLRIGARQSGEALVCGTTDGSSPTPKHHFEFNRFITKLTLPRSPFTGLDRAVAQSLLRHLGMDASAKQLGRVTMAQVALDLYSHVTDTMQAEAPAKLNAV